MRRVVLAGVLLLVGLTIAYGYTVTRRDRVYRQLVVQGDSALSRGAPSAAADAFGEAIGLKPDSMLGYLKRGEAHFRDGDFTRAAEDLGIAAQLDPTAPRAFELMGDVDAGRQLYEGAAGHYDASVRLDDRAPRVLYKLGLAHQLAGRSSDAHDALVRAVALDSRFAEAHSLLGVCLRDMNRLAEAEQAFKRALALSPTLLPAREHLADLYGTQGRRLARIAEMEQVLAAENTPSRHVSLAHAYAAAGQTLRAVRLLRRTAELYPDYPGTYLALGRVWLEASEGGRDKAALRSATEALEQAVSLESSGAILTELGKAYLEAGDVAAARRTLRQAADTLPTEPAVFLHLAEAAGRTGEPLAARAALVDYQALAPDGDRPQIVRQRIGDLSMQLGEPGVAARWYTMAAEGSRATAAVLVKLAEAHRQAGDTAAARAAISRALVKDPQHAAARALDRKLGAAANR